MATHPNRSKSNRPTKANPTPAEIRALRESKGLTEKAAAEMIYCTVGAWIAWERGDRRMHPGLWELFVIKTREPPKRFSHLIP